MGPSVREVDDSIASAERTNPLAADTMDASSATARNEENGTAPVTTDADTTANASTAPASVAATAAAAAVAAAEAQEASPDAFDGLDSFVVTPGDGDGDDDDDDPDGVSSMILGFNDPAAAADWSLYELDSAFDTSPPTVTQSAAASPSDALGASASQPMMSTAEVAGGAVSDRPVQSAPAQNTGIPRIGNLGVDGTDPESLFINDIDELGDPTTTGAPLTDVQDVDGIPGQVRERQAASLESGPASLAATTPVVPADMPAVAVRLQSGMATSLQNADQLSAQQRRHGVAKTGDTSDSATRQGAPSAAATASAAQLDQGASNAGAVTSSTTTSTASTLGTRNAATMRRARRPMSTPAVSSLDLNPGGRDGVPGRAPAALHTSTASRPAGRQHSVDGAEVGGVLSEPDWGAAARGFGSTGASGPIPSSPTAAPGTGDSSKPPQGPGPVHVASRTPGMGAGAPPSSGTYQTSSRDGASRATVPSVSASPSGSPAGSGAPAGSRALAAAVSSASSGALVSGNQGATAVAMRTPDGPRGIDVSRTVMGSSGSSLNKRDSELLSTVRRLEQTISSLDVSARLCLRDALVSLSNKASNPNAQPTPEQEAMNRAAEYLVLRMLFLSGQQVMHTPPGTAMATPQLPSVPGAMSGAFGAPPPPPPPPPPTPMLATPNLQTPRDGASSGAGTAAGAAAAAAAAGLIAGVPSDVSFPTVPTMPVGASGLNITAAALAQQSALLQAHVQAGGSLHTLNPFLAAAAAMPGSSPQTSLAQPHSSDFFGVGTSEAKTKSAGAILLEQQQQRQVQALGAAGGASSAPVATSVAAGPPGTAAALRGLEASAPALGLVPPTSHNVTDAGDGVAPMDADTSATELPSPMSTGTRPPGAPSGLSPSSSRKVPNIAQGAEAARAAHSRVRAPNLESGTPANPSAGLDGDNNKSRPK